MREVQYYEPCDIQCGSPLTIWGRPCLVYDADDFTKQWYRECLGMEQVSVALKTPPPDVLYQPVPSHTGYGTEEDAMGSVVAL